MKRLRENNFLWEKHNHWSHNAECSSQKTYRQGTLYRQSLLYLSIYKYVDMYKYTYIITINGKETINLGKEGYINECGGRGWGSDVYN